jgi:hypothetical protein
MPFSHLSAQEGLIHFPALREQVIYSNVSFNFYRFLNWELTALNQSIFALWQIDTFFYFIQSRYHWGILGCDLFQPEAIGAKSIPAPGDFLQKKQDFTQIFVLDIIYNDV